MGFSRQEYWSGLSCHPPVNLPNSRIKPTSLTSPELTGRSFTIRVLRWGHYPGLFRRISGNLKGPYKSKRKDSLVVQELRICLPVQGTQVWSLVQEDSTCHRTTKPVDHSYWDPHTLEPVVRNKRSHCNKKLQQREAHTLQLEKACAQRWRPGAANK